MDGRNNSTSIPILFGTNQKNAATVLMNIWNYDIIDTGLLAEKIVATKKSNSPFSNNIPGPSKSIYTFLV